MLNSLTEAKSTLGKILFALKTSVHEEINKYIERIMQKINPEYDTFLLI